MAYTTIDDPTIYFNTVLYTGNGSSGRTVTGVGFAPNWVWIKDRGATGNHQTFDTIRGVTNTLQTDRTIAETAVASMLTAFGSDGFTVGDHSGVNDNNNTYVAWNWLAGTSASGNTTGSGTAQSYTASASTTAGFSITAFTGNGTANHTLPHNLGVAPDCFIIKKRVGTGDATVRDWNVYHKSLGNTKRIVLNTTGGVTTSNEYWNDTSPTSSVINLGTNDQINGNNNTYICYAFAEKKGYSKFGKFTANGNDDNAFVYCGFAPRWVMIKPLVSDGWSNWYIFDTARDHPSLNDQPLFANLSTQENYYGGSPASNYNQIDILSNGFKIRRDGNWGVGGDGQESIFMAFADSPFVNSSGVPANAR